MRLLRQRLARLRVDPRETVPTYVNQLLMKQEGYTTTSYKKKTNRGWPHLATPSPDIRTTAWHSVHPIDAHDILPNPQCAHVKRPHTVQASPREDTMERLAYLPTCQKHRGNDHMPHTKATNAKRKRGNEEGTAHLNMPIWFTM